MQSDSQANNAITGSSAEVAVVDEHAHFEDATAQIKAMSFHDAWMMMMAFAGIALAQYHATRFRGFPPRLQSTRELARSRGYRNATHMARVLHEKAQLAAA